MTERLPYRFEATDGLYAGTTFVYYPGDRMVSFRTASPEVWFEAVGAEAAQRMANTTRHAMTPDALERFRAVPVA